MPQATGWCGLGGSHGIRRVNWRTPGRGPTGEPRYEVGLEVVKSLPYGRWRTDDPENTLRFSGLRLHEVGLVKTLPQKLIAQGTDWRFLNELKRELET